MEINEKENKQDELPEVAGETVREEISNNQEDRGNLIDDNIVQLVGFTIEGVLYGINILSVHEIQRIPDITRLPNTSSFILGVINLRGSVIPVVDVRLRFNLSRVPLTDNSRIIVTEVKGKIIGLLVDNVSQVIRVNDDNIDPPADLIEGVSEKFIAGVARMPEGLMIVLNLNHILFSEQEEEIIYSRATNL